MNELASLRPSINSQHIESRSGLGKAKTGTVGIKCLHSIPEFAELFNHDLLSLLLLDVLQNDKDLNHESWMSNECTKPEFESLSNHCWSFESLQIIKSNQMSNSMQICKVTRHTQSVRLSGVRLSGVRLNAKTFAEKKWSCQSSQLRLRDVPGVLPWCMQGFSAESLSSCQTSTPNSESLIWAWMFEVWSLNFAHQS